MSEEDQEGHRRARERRRRLDAVFGTTPEQTRDDLEDRDPREAERGDTWLREQVPPHHGD